MFPGFKVVSSKAQPDRWGSCPKVVQSPAITINPRFIARRLPSAVRCSLFMVHTIIELGPPFHYLLAQVSRDLIAQNGDPPAFRSVLEPTGKC
jgi:hypothetical protein